MVTENISKILGTYTLIREIIRYHFQYGIEGEGVGLNLPPGLMVPKY